MPPLVSVIIPTLDRSGPLRDCLESLWNQSFQDFEIIKVTEEGELAALRNKGAARARGEIIVFIDDDVICSRGWLDSIVRCLHVRSLSGVSGPAVISSKFRKNRDIFRYRFIHEIFTGSSRLPGHISKAGAWTTGAVSPQTSSRYEGPVEFLEACNMAFRHSAFTELGGFDEAYKGVGDWSEPDLCFRLRRAGHNLWFSRDAGLEHCPSTAGAFKKRSSDSRNRMANYELFSSRWIKPCWQHALYKGVLKIYYALKATQ